MGLTGILPVLSAARVVDGDSPLEPSEARYAVDASVWLHEIAGAAPGPEYTYSTRHNTRMFARIHTTRLSDTLYYTIRDTIYDLERSGDVWFRTTIWKRYPLRKWTIGLL